MNKSSQKVFVALSGGVDSSVSAALLKDEGYDVTGVFMKNWSGDDFGIQADCPWEADQKDAENVCKHLGIPFMSFNFEKQYREKVVEYFFDEYKKGRTPNPDVMCNKEIKFKLFLERALQEGADLIATGHYARVTPLSLRDTPPLKKGEIPTLSGEGVTYQLLKGVDSNKDQSYFLYNITQEQLSKTLFPVGHLLKPEVRELARKYKLPNAEKPDSQGICFIGEIDVLKFLMSQIPEKEGNIIDVETDKIVGKHKGIYFYTIGQRAHLPGQKEAYFYCKKDIKNNIMYVCHGSENPLLYSNVTELESLHWIDKTITNYELRIMNCELEAMIRYRQKPQGGELHLTLSPSPAGEGGQRPGEAALFTFSEPQRAITSGQSLVLYDGDVCLGGGIIR